MLRTESEGNKLLIKLEYLDASSLADASISSYSTKKSLLTSDNSADLLIPRYLSRRLAGSKLTRRVLPDLLNSLDNSSDTVIFPTPPFPRN